MHAGKAFRDCLLSALEATTIQAPIVAAAPRSNKQRRQYPKTKTSAIDKHTDATVLNLNGTTTLSPAGQNVTNKVNPDGTHAGDKSLVEWQLLKTRMEKPMIIPIID